MVLVIPNTGIPYILSQVIKRQKISKTWEIMDNKNTTFKFSLISGALKRGAVKTKIKSFCFHSDISLELDEDKGFLESNLLYKFTGEVEKIERLKKFLEGIRNPYMPRFDQSKAYRIVRSYGKALQEPLVDKMLILVLKCRSEVILKESPEDIKEAIKQTFLVATDKDLIQDLVDCYISLGCFIQEEYYQKLLSFIENSDELRKDKSKKAEHLMKEGGLLIEEIEKYIETTRKQLWEEFDDFQAANGFY